MRETAPRRAFGFWGAHASCVLVVASRGDELFQSQPTNRHKWTGILVVAGVSPAKFTLPQEVDHRIDGMVKRLEQIRAEAKAKLKENA